MGEETSDESRTSIEKAIEAISSLISLSHSIKSFTLKWQLIRTKLDDLYSGLAALSNLEHHDPSLSSLISAVLASLTDCYDLATRCVSVAYTGGKLLMQSDLDVMAASLDRHARSLSKIYSAGILSRGFAIVVSKPGGGACKEDVRFYVRDLMTRMKVGDPEMKRRALVKLNEAMEEDDRYVKIVVEIGDLVCLLVGFLDSSDTGVQEESVKALFFISGFGSHKSVLVRSGVIGPLVRVLENGSCVGREASAKCLMKLTENSENAWSVSAHGGVSALLKICSRGEFSGELIASSCGVLRNLVGVEEIKRFMIEEDDTMSTFVKLIGSKEEIVQVNSIDLLLSMCAKDEQTRDVLVRRGGINELVSVLSDPNPLSSSKSKEIALRAIDNLCFGSTGCLNALMSCKFLDHLLYLLSNGEMSVQESALKVTSRLCSLPEEVKRIMGDAGFMPELVKFLDAKSFDVREMASVALYCLISVPKNRKKFAQDDFNISYILKLLDREEGSNVSSDSGSNKFLISILMSLTSCNSARRKIASSGYLKSIEKLAETEGSDAKKLVKKLSMNRFRSMLSGIF
ncbi:ARM repeat superfamily protein [Raphanus sativus]|uniref:Vacuolar protein 8 n=1 Tax=Raphanus sativus TaxID=3726 RepID=A0A6J0LC66_RAPSA|nr:vacuolar protein 8 [Raphanus sativus]KAJ4878509.1 ARM repeat superfamily protein [Raphanus sativus]